MAFVGRMLLANVLFLVGSQALAADGFVLKTGQGEGRRDWATKSRQSKPEMSCSCRAAQFTR